MFVSRTRHVHYSQAIRAHVVLINNVVVDIATLAFNKIPHPDINGKLVRQQYELSLCGALCVTLHFVG
jgi:hypothetical protein